MTHRQGQDCSTPALNLLVILAKIGFAAVFWAVLILTVIVWPMQSILVGVTLVALAGIAAAIESWPHHCPNHWADRARYLRLAITVPCTATPHRSTDDKDGEA